MRNLHFEKSAAIHYSNGDSLGGVVVQRSNDELDLVVRFYELVKDTPASNRGPANNGYEFDNDAFGDSPSVNLFGNLPAFLGTTPEDAIWEDNTGGLMYRSTSNDSASDIDSDVDDSALPETTPVPTVKEALIEALANFERDDFYRPAANSIASDFNRLSPRAQLLVQHLLSPTELEKLSVEQEAAGVVELLEDDFCDIVEALREDEALVAEFFNWPGAYYYFKLLLNEVAPFELSHVFIPVDTTVDDVRDWMAIQWRESRMDSTVVDYLMPVDNDEQKAAALALYFDIAYSDNHEFVPNIRLKRSFVSDREDSILARLRQFADVSEEFEDAAELLEEIEESLPSVLAPYEGVLEAFEGLPTNKKTNAERYLRLEALARSGVLLDVAFTDEQARLDLMKLAKRQRWVNAVESNRISVR